MEQKNTIYLDSQIEQISSKDLEELETLVKQSGEVLNLEVFKIDNLACNKNTLINVCMEIYNKNDIINGLKTDIETMVNFQTTVQTYYLNNYYHNSLHAADVTNTVNWLINNCNVKQYANPIELSSQIIGATVHDVGHPGFNNSLMTNSRTTLSQIYNDQSVLENYHCFLTFQIQSKATTNILANIGIEDYKQFRKTIIHVIQNTDLARHGEVLKHFKSLLEKGDLNMDKEEEKLCLFSLVLKTADIGHAAKTIDLHKTWSRNVTEEFWHQGEKEKENNLPISPLCVKSNNVAKSQIGFIDFLVLPLNKAQNSFLKNDLFEEMHIGQINKNKEYWTEELKKEENGEGSSFLSDTDQSIATIKITNVDIQNLIFPIN